MIKRGFSSAVLATSVAMVALAAVAFEQWQRKKSILLIDQRIAADEQRFRLSSPADIGTSHVDARLFMIKSQMAQTERPIVLVGDSITEAALLPSTICGRPVINAGIGGLGAQSYSALVKSIFNRFNATLVVVALGTNDAAIGSTSASFREAYISLIEFLRPRTDRLLFAGILAMSGALAQRSFDPALAQQNDAFIRQTASDSHSGFVDLHAATLGDDLTLDGVHLNAAGYKLWASAMIASIKASEGCIREQ